MSYSPPGVITLVQIDNNIVSLPGGTRILSLIGTGRKTKNIQGETVTQPISRISSVLQHTGVTSLNSIYDFSGPGGAQIFYPTTGTGAFGSGYFLSSDTINWSVAANPYPTSTTPAVSQQFFVTYVGATGGAFGSVTYSGESVTQTSSHEISLLHSGISVTAVSGASGFVYPASGTVTTVDSSGYGRARSGYVLSPSGTLLWGAVPTGSYSWPFATTPPLSGSYFADYTYAKSGTDYVPKNFVDYSLVTQEYGPEANWNLITTGPNAGKYSVGSLNPLTLAARLAFANGASIVSLTQMSGLGTTAGDFQNSLNQLQSEQVDIVVPLSVGSGSSLTEISTTEKGNIIQTTLQHCDTMSLPQNKKERVGAGSLGVAEIGNATTVDTYVFDAQSSFHDKRMTLIAPGIATVQIQDPTGAFQNVQVDAAFMAAAYGALSCNPLSDVATPLTRQRFTGFVGISSTTPNHPNSSYLEIEKDILGGAGVCVIDRLGSNIFVRQQLTTDVSNPAVAEFSVVTSTDYVSQSVRFTCDGFIGKKLIPAIVIPAVKSTILATMQVLAQDNLISAIGAISVQVDPTDPTQILATVQYVPIFPLNHLRVTFTLRTQL